MESYRQANTEVLAANPIPLSLGLASNPGLRGVIPGTGRLGQGTLNEQPEMYYVSTRTTQFPRHTNTLRPHCNYDVFLQSATSVSLSVLTAGHTNLTANFQLFILMLSSFSKDVLKKRVTLSFPKQHFTYSDYTCVSRYPPRPSHPP